MQINILGIRHHGAGSARKVKAALEKFQPDIVLIEGPPDAEPMLPWVSSAEMLPPVAMLIYVPEEPHRASFYPFAEFSPEWQAMKFAQNQDIPIRFMDLPLTHKLAIMKEMENAPPPNPLIEGENEAVSEDTDKSADIKVLSPSGKGFKGEVQLIVAKIKANSSEGGEGEISKYPLDYLAEAAGYDDHELWWEHWFEQRQTDEEAFEAIMEAMKALREQFPEPKNHIEILREVYMRKVIRQAQKDGFQKIAIVCGAWHAPALAEMPPQKQDEELLKKLPKIKVECTWIPWTYDRLTFESGYGAGIASPGWYQHLWDYPNDNGALWLSKVARLFREKQMDISVAHVIEGVRLAESLAAIRHLPKVGLYELNEATQTVLCFGESIMMELINKELIVSNRMGSVPTGVPKVPLQVDLEKAQKRLRMKVTPDRTPLHLDLRENTDLERSKLLHRLSLLGIQWGENEEVSSRGTFKEKWSLQWQPELVVKTIEMGIWGNTIEEATTKFVIDITEKSNNLAQVSDLINKAIPADLQKVTEVLIVKVNALAALTSDIIELMKALPSLAYVSRYGNVRKTDLSMLQNVVNGLITRICIGLPPACYSLDADAATLFFEQITQTNQAISLIQSEEQTADWQKTLRQLADSEQMNGLIVGSATRLLFDAKAIEATEAEIRLSKALSSEPSVAATWLEGFLKGSGMILLLDDTLWNILYAWVKQLDEQIFLEILPLLRRTFANFSTVERRKMGEKAKAQSSGQTQKAKTSSNPSDFDLERGEKAMQVVKMLLGLK